MSPSGIEPATFRLVQRPNQMRPRVPPKIYDNFIKIKKKLKNILKYSDLYLDKRETLRISELT